jgi:hypothetical protein
MGQDRGVIEDVVIKDIVAYSQQVHPVTRFGDLQ